MDRLISIGELAELKAVSVDTIRRWENEGKIKSVRTNGGHRRYRLADFVEQKLGNIKSGNIGIIHLSYLPLCSLRSSKVKSFRCSRKRYHLISQGCCR
ncbi:MerR family DNA-binding transcriptional regulator [Microcoleus sp.]|uniref:MerR family DNA-binding transcriptional regulator n=1 Tax=Microcoleus sp. TaxID=44472 RepID=UPI0035257DC5